MMKDVSTWSKDDLEWGLVGCAHDMDHALEMIIDAENEEEASKAGKEYMDVVLTHHAYQNELNRREKEGE